MEHRHEKELDDYQRRIQQFEEIKKRRKQQRKKERDHGRSQAKRGRIRAVIYE